MKQDGERFWKIPQCYVRGNSIKYCCIPEEVRSQHSPFFKFVVVIVALVFFLSSHTSTSNTSHKTNPSQHNRTLASHTTHTTLIHATSHTPIHTTNTYILIRTTHTSYTR